MQENLAYSVSTVQVNTNRSTSENEYDIPDVKSSRLANQKKENPTTLIYKATQPQKKRFRIRYIEIPFMIATVLTVLILFFIQLSNNTSQQQEILMCKLRVQQVQENLNNSVRLMTELSSMQENISKQLSELLNISLIRNIPATATLSTEQATTITPTTEPESPTVITPTTLPSEVCGGPGWRRVAFINMTDLNQNCPQGLNLTTYSIRSCGRGHTGRGDCSSVTFPVDGPQYNQVCGRVLAYRWGLTYAFLGYHANRQTIDGAYVDGLSLTHGSPRTHIWTLASGWFNGTSNGPYRNQLCPCDAGISYDSPTYVGNDYFCDSVETEDNYQSNSAQFYPDNALWDGQDLLNPCYGLNNPPWFNKTLPEPATDDIELRMCLHSDESQASTAIELVELHVK